MNSLYPLLFDPILKRKIWGGERMKKYLGKETNGFSDCGESWEISGIQGDISIVNNGFLSGNNLQELIEIYMDELVGEKVYNQYGVEFPLLIKFIDASAILSLQVHPNDELAKTRHNAYGKTEMWYIIQAEPDAELITGFNRPLNEKTYLEHLKNSTLKEILNTEKVKADDVFFIPAGRIHSIGAGILLAEIQQTSDITYRIYDWERTDKKGKSRQLHTEMATGAIDYNYYKQYRTSYETILNSTGRIIHCDFFKTNIIEFDHALEKDYSFNDSFVIYLCIDGQFTINYENSGELIIQKGQTVLIPASLNFIKLIPALKTRILEVYV